MRATIISSARTIGVKMVSSSEDEEVAVGVDLLTSEEIVVVVVAPVATEEARFFVFIPLLGLTREAKISRTDSLEVE